MGVVHVRYWKEFCGSESFLSAPRPHKTYRVEAKSMVPVLPHGEFLPATNFELRPNICAC